MNSNEELNDIIDPGSIYCANCKHCVLFRQMSAADDNQYLLRVKCTQEQWRKKLGKEKMYKYFTVARRTVTSCPDYKEMGDLRTFLKILRKNLPVRDEVYNIKK